VDRHLEINESFQLVAAIELSSLATAVQHRNQG